MNCKHDGNMQQVEFIEHGCIHCWKERAENLTEHNIILQAQVERLVAARDAEVVLREKAESCCAEMRHLLEWSETLLCNVIPMPHCTQQEWDRLLKNWRDQKHTISSDCGKAWVSPEAHASALVAAQMDSEQKAREICTKMGWVSPEVHAAMGVQHMNHVNEIDGLKQQLSALQGKYDAALEDWHRSDTKLAAAVKALEKMPCTCVNIRIDQDWHEDSCAERAAQEALDKIKEDK